MESKDATADAAAAAAAAAETRGAALGRFVGSSEGIYGLVIVAGLIVVSRDLSGSSLGALLSIIATLLVFFAAHVYASAMSWMGGEGRGRGLRAAVWHGVRHSLALPLVGAIPVVFLGLGYLRILPGVDAVWLALIADIVLLGVLGWFVGSRASSGIWPRVSGVLLSIAFGAVLIALKVFVHH
ncbi:hypothetical protein ACFU0W_09540 [Microbacterium keratanolyticum]|uniref:hypothetical protein n=1 Tax=Microbacterium keratanolyticum TaxID=67574 RepID=UPI00363BEB68